MLIANLVFFGIIAFLLFKAITYFAPKFMPVNLNKYKKSADGTWAIVTGIFIYLLIYYFFHLC